MNNMAVCNYIVGFLGTLIGVLIMHAASAFPLEFTENGPGAGFWPFALGCILMLVSVLLLLYTFSKKSDLGCQRVNLTTPANKRVYIMMGMVVIFCIMINLLGFYLAAAIMIASIMHLMDYHNKKATVITAILTLLFIYLIFGQILHTQMPQSIFWE